MGTLSLTCTVNIAGALSGLASCPFWIFCVLVVPQNAAVALLYLITWGSFKEICQDRSHSVLPGLDLPRIGHRGSITIIMHLEEAAVFCNKP